MFDDDYDYDPTEPFSEDEFVTYNDRELRNLDAGRNADCASVPCPCCGRMVRIDSARCRSCGMEYPG